MFDSDSSSPHHARKIFTIVPLRTDTFLLKRHANEEETHRFYPCCIFFKNLSPSRRLKCTSAKGARMYNSIGTSVKKRLQKVDSGRCLITIEKPSASLPVAHIVTLHMMINSKSQVTGLKMWKQARLNLDSTKNLLIHWFHSFATFTFN